MDKKMICGVMLTAIGFVFSVICFIHVLLHPWNYEGIDGLLGSLLGTDTLVPTIVSLAVMVSGLTICFRQAFQKEK